MAEISGALIGLGTVFAVLTIAVWVHQLNQRRGCPMCAGQPIGTRPGGRPDWSLCDKHYLEAWTASSLPGDGE